MKAEEIVITFLGPDDVINEVNFRDIVTNLGWSYGLSYTVMRLMLAGPEVEILSISIRGVEVRDDTEAHEVD